MTGNGPTFCDVLDPRARESHQPVSCPNKTLTAFCQLGALRLNARRCLLFFFDVNNAYVLAEATRSLSLEDDSVHDDGDQLWLGYAMIPRDIACCETTVKFPPPAGLPSMPSEIGRESLFVVGDLAENCNTKDKPYVTAFPHSRFYAGVPIKSPAGINIGSYCVLDDDPRDSISARDAAFMQDMSRTVMTHLETLRAQSERQRASNMVTGLGALVQASSDSMCHERQHATRRSRTGSDPTMRESDLPVETSQRPIKCGVPEALARLQESVKDSVVTPGHSEYFDSKTVKAQCSNKILSASSDQRLPATIPESAVQMDHFPSPPHNGRSRSGEILPTPRATDGVSPGEHRPVHTSHGSKANISAFQRASEIMCNSLSMDGVAFLDASVGTFGGLSEDVEAFGDTESTSTCGESKWVVETPNEDSSSHGQNAPNPCNVLGCAMSSRDIETSDYETWPARKLTERFLRRLLSRHPCGNIWTFDRFGVATDDELTYCHEGIQDSMASEQRRNIKQRRRDSEALQAMFPGARTIAIHGIRDEHGRRFNAACLLWSFDALRIITQASEMSFVAAFCNIVVAEDRRHEVQRADQAKSDFLSSISHELRTPLCGILGSTDVLRDHGLDSMALALVEQVNACGRTLLDIIDSLLDFANLKSQRLKQGSVNSTNVGRMLVGRRNSSQGDDTDVDMSIALDDLTEEVTESTVFSYFCQKSSEERSRISVVMDIDRSPNTDWSCTLASGGWRRICMSLINNALKYTGSGYVRISMNQRQRSHQHFDAILTIADSGKGMSRAFINKELFRDFTQEDSNADGVGLGMNLVGQMVNAMGGSIEVNSDQNGAGTCVVVRLPLERRRTAASRSISKDSLRLSLGEIPEGLAIGIFSNSQERRLSTTDRREQLEITAGTLAISSIEKTCKHLGLEARTGTWSDCTATKLNFMLEEDFVKQVNLMQNNFDASSTCIISSVPSVVICKNSPSAQTIQEAWRNHPHHRGIIAEYIASPCGLRTISRTITLALQRHKAFWESEALNFHGNDRRRQFAIETRTRSLDDASFLRLDVKDDSATVKLSPPAPIGTEKHDAQRSPLPEGEQERDVHIAHRQASFSVKQQEPQQSLQDITDKYPPVLLLVDDNSINLQLLQTYAKKRKYPYLSAIDGQLALDAYTQAHEKSTQTTPSAGKNLRRPSIVLMDINMPKMDGYESTQRIRAYERKHRLTPSKIVALTALSSAAAHKEAFGSGFDLFMTKPVKFKDLTKIVEGGLQSDTRMGGEGVT
jgi:signal transduction histidine kinase/CheY-like chemotaxis protein